MQVQINIQEMDEIKNHIQYLVQENSEIKKRLEQLEKRHLETNEIYGFKLLYKNERGRWYWYATRVIEGKQIWIYIGKAIDLDKVREKISDWQTKQEENRRN